MYRGGDFRFKFGWDVAIETYVCAVMIAQNDNRKEVFTMIYSTKEILTEKKALYKSFYKTGGTFHMANANGICAEGCNYGCRTIGEGAFNHAVAAEKP